MSNIFKICQVFLLTFGLVVLFSTTATVNAQEDPLEGKVFTGQFREKHIRAVEEDELRFIEGEFHSKVHGQKGFNGGVYTVRAAEGRIHFEAETVSPKQGKIRWRGIIHGDSIEVDFRWIRKGWFSDTVKDYLFNGTLQK